MTEKFKIWHKTQKLWISQANVCINGYGKMWWVVGDRAERLVPDDYIICHFTDCLDRHGNEIYEGDIVYMECHDGDEFVGLTKWFPVHTHFSIVGKDSEGKYQTRSVGFGGSNVKDIKVIGNIFEHEDLIKNINTTDGR